MTEHPTTSPEAAADYAHLVEHVYAQPGDCTPTRDLRHMLNQALTLYRDTADKLAHIEQPEALGLEVADS